MHYACKNGNLDIVRMMLIAGTDINLRDINGFNCSYWAKAMKHMHLLEFLPPIKSISPEDYLEFAMQKREIHEYALVRKGKKKKKKKKKK